MSERTRKLAWAAVIVASATAISRVVGLGREVLTAGVYGVTPDYNVFVSVSVVPNLIRQLFADAAISAAFVPVLTAL
ncbi:MAG TPA: lipid II flippase MurJ, partial [Coriobacteriia bacterium]